MADSDLADQLRNRNQIGFRPNPRDQMILTLVMDANPQLTDASMLIREALEVTLSAYSRETTQLDAIEAKLDRLLQVVTDGAPDSR
jgi:phage tail protein X